MKTAVFIVTKHQFSLAFNFNTFIYLSSILFWFSSFRWFTLDFGSFSVSFFLLDTLFSFSLHWPPYVLCQPCLPAPMPFPPTVLNR